MPVLPQPISRPAHCFTDYPYVAAVTAAPALVGFQGEKSAVTLGRALATTILVSSVLTRAERGFIPALSYKTHLTLDTLGGLTALSAPWLFGFAGNAKARNTFLAMGVFGLIAGLASRPEEMP